MALKGIYWGLDPAFVGGSHERRGSTSNASTLREHSASVAAAHVCAQGEPFRQLYNSLVGVRILICISHPYLLKGDFD